MTVRPDSSAIMFLELEVMYETKDRLEKEQNEDNDTNDRVVIVEHVDWYVVDHPNADTECCDVYDIRKELKQAVDKPNAAE
jgi:hypothetical protein